MTKNKTYRTATEIAIRMELIKPTKIKCKECGEIIAIEESNVYFSGYADLYCPTCWKIKKLKE